MRKGSIFTAMIRGVSESNIAVLKYTLSDSKRKMLQLINFLSRNLQGQILLFFSPRTGVTAKRLADLGLCKTPSVDYIVNIINCYH